MEIRQHGVIVCARVNTTPQSPSYEGSCRYCGCSVWVAQRDQTMVIMGRASPACQQCVASLVAAGHATKITETDLH